MNYLYNTEPITEIGKQQAILAGKYLKTYGEFDLVISSPATRCIETAENICKEINYSKKIVINKLIEEQLPGNLSGLSREESSQFIKNMINENDTLKKMGKELNETTDPFRRIELLPLWGDFTCKIIGHENMRKTINNHKKFLTYLKKLDKKCILIVGHGGTIKHMTHIITNTFYDNNPNISILSTEQNKENNKKTMDIGNTSIMACLIKKKLPVTLVIAPNTLHLKDLQDNKKS
jgi:broad specificity phosphatase PhoE